MTSGFYCILFLTYGETEMYTMFDAMRDVARRNVENNLGNCDPDEDVGENIYVLALDALLDADFDPELSRQIAQAMREEMGG